MRKLGKYTQLAQTDDVPLERLAWCNLRASLLEVGRSLGVTVEEELLTGATVWWALASIVYVIACCVQCQISYENCLHVTVSD